MWLTDTRRTATGPECRPGWSPGPASPLHSKDLLCGQRCCLEQKQGANKGRDMRATRRASLEKRLQAGDRAPEDERVNIVRALVRIHRFEIGEVAHDAECGRNPIGAEHVARQAGDIERLARVVALDERDRFRSELPRIQ